MVHFGNDTNYVSLFAMDHQKLFASDKISVSSHTNMSPKYYIKR